MRVHPKVEAQIEELDLYNSVMNVWYGKAEGPVVPEVIVVLRVWDEAAPEGIRDYWVYLDDEDRVFHFPEPISSWTEGLPPGTCSEADPPM